MSILEAIFGPPRRAIPEYGHTPVARKVYPPGTGPFRGIDRPYYVDRRGTPRVYNPQPSLADKMPHSKGRLQPPSNLPGSPGAKTLPRALQPRGFLVPLLFAGAFLCLAGCTTPPPVLLSSEVQTNALGTVSTNYAPNVLTTSTAGAVGLAFGPWGTLGATVLTSALGLWAAWLNRRQKRFSVATVQGIETVRQLIRASGQTALDNKIKTILEAAHADAGLADLAASIIDQYTGYTTVEPLPVLAPRNAIPPTILPSPPQQNAS